MAVLLYTPIPFSITMYRMYIHPYPTLHAPYTIYAIHLCSILYRLPALLERPPQGHASWTDSTHGNIQLRMCK